MSVQTGQTFGRYRVERVLGQGGFAFVCLAFDPALQRRVALKILHEHLAADSDLAARFQDEARQLGHLRHANIVAVHDVGEEHDRPYFAMDYLEGQTLADRLAAHGRLSLPEAARLALQLASALDYLHALPLIHRDLKPSNVMIAPDGHVTLLDFGIARALDRTSHTRTGTILGTPEYMAPEQVQGRPVGPPADIYALGALLYHALCGRPPFEGDTLSVMHQQVSMPPPPLADRRPGLPPAVCAAIDAALAKDPAARPRRAADLAAAIARGAGVAPPPGVAPYPQPDRRPVPPGGPDAYGPTEWVPPRPAPAAVRSPLPLLLAAGVAAAFVAVIAILAASRHAVPSGPSAQSPAAAGAAPADAGVQATSVPEGSQARASAPPPPPPPPPPPAVDPTGVYRRIQNTGAQQCLNGRTGPSTSQSIAYCVIDGFIVHVPDPATWRAADGHDWYSVDGVGWMAARDDSDGTLYFGDLGTPPPPAQTPPCLHLDFHTTLGKLYPPPSSLASSVTFSGAHFNASNGTFSGWVFGTALYLLYRTGSGSGSVMADELNGSLSGRFVTTATGSGSGSVGTVSGSNRCN